MTLSTKNYFHLVSLGCPKNLVDSEIMIQSLLNASFQWTDQIEVAHILIVNTCSFIASAKKESINTILELSEWKKKGFCELLVVTGCFAQQSYQELEKALPEVDLLIGTTLFSQIARVIKTALSSKKVAQSFQKRSYVEPKFPKAISSSKRFLTGLRYRSYLKISEGCNHRCTFCVIPKLRGPLRSRPLLSLIKEARWLASQGVRELNLIAQDLTDYGAETKFQKESLPKLLQELEKIPTLKWIRLHYVYPERITDELIQTIAHCSKIVPYLDMPIQHTDTTILKRMQRRLDREQLFHLIEKIRLVLPHMVFRTSIIVGFPGETQEAFQTLCHDLESLAFEYAGVFTYSKEPNTPAASMAAQIPQKIKNKRAAFLRKLLNKTRLRKFQALLKTHQELLIDHICLKKRPYAMARLQTQAYEIDSYVKLWIPKSLKVPLQVGTFVSARIEKAHPHYLTAKWHPIQKATFSV